MYKKKVRRTSTLLKGFEMFIKTQHSAYHKPFVSCLSNNVQFHFGKHCRSEANLLKALHRKYFPLAFSGYTTLVAYELCVASSPAYIVSCLISRSGTGFFWQRVMSFFLISVYK